MEKLNSIKSMTEPASPCVSICALDEEDICIGCYRSADEISNWVSFDPQRKLEVLENCLVREKKVNPFL